MPSIAANNNITRNNDYQLPSITKSNRLNQSVEASEFNKSSTNSILPPPIRPFDAVNTEEIEELTEFYTRVQTIIANEEQLEVKRNA